MREAALRILAALNSDLPAAGFLEVVGRTLREATGCECLITEADSAGSCSLQWHSQGCSSLPAEAQLKADDPRPRYGRAAGGYFASLPLLVSNRLAGGIHLFGKQRFGSARRRWLEFISGEVSRWLGRAAQLRLLAHQAANLEIALQSGATGWGMDHLLTGALRNMADTLQADSCSLMLADRDSGQLLVDTAYGLTEAAAATRPGEGIASYVLRTGEPLLLNDPRHDPRLAGITFVPRPGIVSSICVPIRVGGAVEGVVSLNRTRGKSRRPFTESDLRLAVGLVGQLAPCVENAILYQRSAGMVREMSTISQAAGAASTAADPAQTCTLIARAARQLLGAGDCTVFLVEQGCLGDAHPPGTRAAACTQAALASGQVQQQGELLACPIRVGSHLLAVLQVHTPGHRVAPGQVELLTRFLAGVAVSLQHSLAHRLLAAHLAELNLVQRGLQRMSASWQPEAVLAALATASKELLAGDRASFALDTAAWNPRPTLHLPRDCRVHWLASDAAAREALARVPETGVLECAAHPALGSLLGEGQASRVVVAQMRAGGRNLGSLICPVTANPPPERLSAIGLLAQHAGAIIKQALDYREASLQQSLEVSALYRLCEQISSATDFESALSSALDIVGSMVDFDQAAIYLWEGEPGRLRLITARGQEAATDPAERDICHWVAREGKAFLSSRALESPGQVSSLVAVPLVIEQRCLGVLSVRAHARSRPYSEDQVKLLSIIGSQAAAIYHAIQSLGTLSRYTDNILESMLSGVIGLDNEGRVVMWSRAAERILDYPASQATGRTLEVIASEIMRHHGRGAASLPLLVRRVTTTGAVVAGHAVHLAGPEGGRHLSISCSPLRDHSGAPMGSVLLIEDVTERRQMEEQVAQMNQLATVGHLAANVAHEIRNPISAIKTAAQFLRREYQGEGLIDQFAGIINEECDRLSKVTSDFLSFARPSALSFQPTSIAGVLDRTLQLVGPQLDAEGIRLEQQIDHLPDIPADRDELVQVFLNLVLNAVQAIEGQGTITITARRYGEQGVEVAVTDTGCGIPEEALEQVFRPFYTTKTKGTGLGLAIVRKIVEAHGGTVEITSKLRHGTTCRVLLPGAQQESVPATARSAPQEPDLVRAVAAGQLHLFPGD